MHTYVCVSVYVYTQTDTDTDTDTHAVRMQMQMQTQMYIHILTPSAIDRSPRLFDRVRPTAAWRAKILGIQGSASGIQDCSCCPSYH